MGRQSNAASELRCSLPFERMDHLAFRRPGVYVRRGSEPDGISGRTTVVCYGYLPDKLVVSSGSVLRLKAGFVDHLLIAVTSRVRDVRRSQSRRYVVTTS